MGEIKTILMKRDGMIARDAQDLIDEATEALLEYLVNNDEEGADGVCNEFFNLEPDYLMDDPGRRDSGRKLIGTQKPLIIK